jgi:hypothetical protein
MPRVNRQLITRELGEGEFSSGSSATPTNVDLHTMILLESFLFFLLPLSLSLYINSVEFIKYLKFKFFYTFGIVQHRQ